MNSKLINRPWKFVKKVSKENEGRFTVGVMVPSTCYVNGKDEDNL